MAYKQTAKKEKKVYIETPSTCGSHASMRSTEDTHVAYMEAHPDRVILQDNDGFYITETKALDNGICDYNRRDNLDKRSKRLKYALKFYDMQLKAMTKLKQDKLTDTMGDKNTGAEFMDDPLQPKCVDIYHL